MNPPETARRWQARLDRDFPRGILLSSIRREAAEHTFLSPRAEVTSVRGLDPVVFLDIPGHGRGFSGVITGYNPVQSSPCRVVEVTLDYGGDNPSRDRTVLFSGNVSDSAARAMAPYREKSLRLSAEGLLYNGDTFP